MAGGGQAPEPALHGVRAQYCQQRSLSTTWHGSTVVVNQTHRRPVEGYSPSAAAATSLQRPITRRLRGVCAVQRRRPAGSKHAPGPFSGILWQSPRRTRKGRRQRRARGDSRAPAPSPSQSLTLNPENRAGGAQRAAERGGEGRGGDWQRRGSEESGWKLHSSVPEGPRPHAC